MDEREIYLFRVSHPNHGDIEVEAADRYTAVTGAAKEWGLRWSTICRDCIVMQLSSTPVRRLRPKRKA